MCLLLSYSLWLWLLLLLTTSPLSSWVHGIQCRSSTVQLECIYVAFYVYRKLVFLRLRLISKFVFIHFSFGTCGNKNKTNTTKLHISCVNFTQMIRCLNNLRSVKRYFKNNMERPSEQVWLRIDVLKSLHKNRSLFRRLFYLLLSKWTHCLVAFNTLTHTLSLHTHLLSAKQFICYALWNCRLICEKEEKTKN